MDVQLPLLLKILSFNRTLRHSVDNTIVIGVIYQSRFRYSREIKEEFEEAAARVQQIMGTYRIKYQYIDIDRIDPATRLRNEQFSALYITPLRAYGVGDILTITRAEKVLSMTGVPEYTEKGVAVCIGLKADKPQIIIKLSGARAEGVDFSAQLLKFAKILE